MATVRSPRLLCSPHRAVSLILYTLWIDIVDLCIRLRGRFVLKDCRIGFGCLLVEYSFNKHLYRVYRLSSPHANRRQQQRGLGLNQLTRNPRAKVSTSRTFSQCEWESDSEWESERARCASHNAAELTDELMSWAHLNLSHTHHLPLLPLPALPVCLSVCLSAYQLRLCWLIRGKSGSRSRDCSSRVKSFFMPRVSLNCFQFGWTCRKRRSAQKTSELATNKKKLGHVFCWNRIRTTTTYNNNTNNNKA